MRNCGDKVFFCKLEAIRIKDKNKEIILATRSMTTCTKLD